MLSDERNAEIREHAAFADEMANTTESFLLSRASRELAEVLAENAALREQLAAAQQREQAARARLERVRRVRDREIARYDEHRRNCPIPLTEAERAWLAEAPASTEAPTGQAVALRDMPLSAEAATEMERILADPTIPTPRGEALESLSAEELLRKAWLAASPAEVVE